MKKFKTIEDLSYSGLSELIQDNSKEASNVLVTLAMEKESIQKEIEFAEKKLANLKTRRSDLIAASLLIVEKKLEKPLPLAVQRKGFIVVISDKNISIEHNVI